MREPEFQAGVRLPIPPYAVRFPASQGLEVRDPSFFHAGVREPLLPPQAGAKLWLVLYWKEGCFETYFLMKQRLPMLGFLMNLPRPLEYDRLTSHHPCQEVQPTYRMEREILHLHLCRGQRRVIVL